MRRLLTLSLCLFLVVFAEAQEINSKVTINTPKLQTTDPRVFKTMETAVQEFLNNTKWTNDIYEAEERIDVTININIREEASSKVFLADFYVQASRPIYGSNQSTAMFEHNDKDFGFEYEEFQPLEFSDNIFNDNLTSFLAFYTYVILGLDYDSFSREGGTEYFQKAQDIVNSVPTSLNAAFQKGWRSIDANRNRYWIIESMLSPRTQQLRQANYEYHRMGLDMMSENADEARESIFQAMKKVKTANEDYPNAMITQLFVNAKSEEIIEIFLKGTNQQKREVYATMVRIDAANASKYRSMRQ
ncbi:MAG: DUF4835 family protein [Bacteroidota bacterium]